MDELQIIQQFRQGFRMPPHTAAVNRLYCLGQLQARIAQHGGNGGLPLTPL